MKIPGAVWMIAIPIFVAAITPVIVQFYPPATVMWSALLVAVLGAAVSFIAALQNKPAQPTPGEPGAPMPAGAPMPEAKPRGLGKRWMLGA